MLRLPDPCFVVLVGPSGAGKSTWAAASVDPGLVVSSDDLRGVVGESPADLQASADAFAVLELVVAARVRRRLTTVVDTLGLDPVRRAAWLDLARRAGLPAIAVAFGTPPAVCRRRAASRSPRVPAAVLTAQLAAYAEQRPRLDDEGWDLVVNAEPVRLVHPEVAAAARADRLGASPGAAPRPPAPGGHLRHGLHLSTWAPAGGAPVLRSALADVARRAEAAGLDSVWVMDHLRQIPQVGRAWDDMLESIAVLGHLTAVTERVQLGCLVHGVTLRNVGVLGRSVATLDVLSGGRMWCGLGAGWFAAEQAAYGITLPPAAERLDVLEDALQALPLLWGPGSPSFAGRHVRLPEAMGYPRPLRGGVPLLVGGSGPRRTLRLVAQYADACNLRGGPGDVRRSLEVLRAHCADAGRDPTEIEVTHLSTALVAPDASALADEVQRRAPARGRARWAQAVSPGTVEDHVLRLEALRDAGVQHVITNLVGVWDSAALETWAGVVERTAARP